MHASFSDSTALGRRELRGKSSFAGITLNRPSSPLNPIEKTGRRTTSAGVLEGVSDSGGRAKTKVARIGESLRVSTLGIRSLTNPGRRSLLLASGQGLNLCDQLFERRDLHGFRQVADEPGL